MLGDKAKAQSIDGLRQTLSAIETLLEEDKTRNGFRPDKTFDTTLRALAAKLDVNENAMLSKLRSLDDDLAGTTLGFYASVAELQSLIDTHAKAAAADDNTFTKAKAKLDAATLVDSENAVLAGHLRWAVLLSDDGARLVELGGVSCGSSGKPVAKCPEGESPSAVAYRSEVGAASFTKGDLATPAADAVPVKKIVPLISGGIRDTLIKGAEGVASEVYYQNRLRTVYELLVGKPAAGGRPSGGLIDVGNDLAARMTAEMNREKRLAGEDPDNEPIAIKDVARDLLGDKTKPQSISGLKQTLSVIDTLLDESKTKHGLRPDKTFDTALKALAAKLDVNQKAVLSRAKSLDDHRATLAFYSGIAEVKSLLDTHVRAAAADNNALAKSTEKPEVPWVVVISAPTETDASAAFGAKLVELGGFYCDGSDRPVAKCPDAESPTAVAYRSEVGAAFLTKGNIASPGTDAIPAKTIVALSGNSIRDALIKGAEGVASEIYYQKRLRTLSELLRGKAGGARGLIEVGNDLERKMTAEINR